MSMRSPRISALYCALALFSSAICAAQQPAAELEIHLPAKTFKAGLPIKLEVIIRNVSTRDFVVPKVSPGTEGMADAYTDVEVIDSSGQKLLRIDGQTLVKSGKSYTISKRWLTRRGAIVEPNGTLRDFLVLTSLFDLSKPGVYNISARAEIPAPDSGPQIKWIEAVSNRASFAVTQ